MRKLKNVFVCICLGLSVFAFAACSGTKQKGLDFGFYFNLLRIKEVGATNREIKTNAIKDELPLGRYYELIFTPLKNDDNVVWVWGLQLESVTFYFEANETQDVGFDLYAVGASIDGDAVTKAETCNPVLFQMKKGEVNSVTVEWNIEFDRPVNAEIYIVIQDSSLFNDTEFLWRITRVEFNAKHVVKKL